jgi:capsule polysaccharide export protein KpsE/RkpR
VISISVSATDPALAAKLTNGYVEELNRVVTDDSTSAARRERIFLEGRVKDVKQDLDDSSKALSQFSAKNMTIDISSQEKSMVESGLKLQGELSEGRSQLAALRQTYSEDNHLVKAMEARNAELQREIDAMGGKPKNKGSTAGANGSAYPTAGELPALGLTYYDLERKVRVDEAVWEELTKEYEMAKVEEARQVPSVGVLDAANIPQRKTSPVRRNIVAVGTSLSFLFAIILVLALDHWEQMDPLTEPKKMVMEVFDSMMRFRPRS